MCVCVCVCVYVCMYVCIPSGVRLFLPPPLLVSMLDAWVEELRVDVAQRGCKVVPSEIHVLSDSVAALARGLLELQSEP